MPTLPMTKDKVKAGTRFYVPDQYGSIQYYFSYCRSNQLQVCRKGGHHIGYVREVLEDGFYLSTYILRREAAVFIAYTELEYFEPNKEE